jgi:hypothetical protein
VIFFFPHVIRVVPAGPDWTAKTTAIGTVVVAAVAVSVALFAERRASTRLKEECERSADLLAEERTRSDEERDHATARIKDERRTGREREHAPSSSSLRRPDLSVP